MLFTKQGPQKERVGPGQKLNSGAEDSGGPQVDTCNRWM